MHLKMKTIIMYCHVHENTSFSEQLFTSQGSAITCEITFLVLLVIQSNIIFLLNEKNIPNQARSFNSTVIVT